MIREINISTRSSQEIVDITDKVNDIVVESKIESGICFIYNPHTTAAVFINEGADPSVKYDILTKLNSLISPDDRYTHSEGNSHAHIKSAIMGNSLTIFIENSRLLLGRWQSVYFFEGDGPRSRKIYVKIIKG